MKTTNYYKIKAMSKVVFAFVLSLTMLLSSCKDENEARSQFTLKDNPSKMEAPARGSSETYTVQSSGNWKVEPQRKEKWLKIDPMEGNGDGTFTVTVNKNIAQGARNVTLFFTVDGQLHNSVLKIEQAAGTGEGEEEDPYIYLDGNLTKLESAEAGGVSNYVLRANGKWRLELEDQPDWVNIEPMEGTGDTPLKLTVAKNTDLERTANLFFFLEDVQQSQSVSVYQKGQKLQVPGDLVLKEDFNWLSYGSEIFNVTTGETRIGSWKAEDLAKGWTSTINTTTGGGDYASIYARPGFVKLGRTNYGGDLISPKLEKVQRTKDLLVTFKAVRYATGDHYLLTVGVNGPGTVSVKEFDIMNVASPNSNLEACRAAWQAPEATYSFVVKGATAETQVWFLGGAFDQRAGNWPKTTNRIFVDDVVVTVK
ncbi:Putative binding domain-containing protein, N-terminal [Sphingobacterium nematocida]|uniref:Putative binding domain-containing protein, N-terminal n=1 Tax=Sphingobacterium nematocida TaxID=1513896 RepID=A0A1T5D029_9SPHI|nr:BACON domain-containing protein [Sphingobacterium nematocida]SKB65064.1 Putative binding domain-containing protein, N-terminal [Sphingobacterium nematocida]